MPEPLATSGEHPPSLRLEAISKVVVDGPRSVSILDAIDLEVPRGQLVAITGPSGSGKTTLLNLIGLLDRPSAGRLFVGGVETSTLDEASRTRLRGEALGFVFQFHHLLPALTAEENVAMTIAVREGRLTERARAQARGALERLSIAHLAGRKPSEMSGGQRQRVAVARALVAEPSVVLADEPTGNLDTETGAAVFDEMQRLNRELGLTFIIVTHDERLAHRCERVVELVDGSVRSDEQRGPA